MEPLQYLTPPKKETLSEKIAYQIKELIFLKRIESGQKLASERELANVLGVSRIAVREALKSLEQSGLIEIRLGRMGGTYVTANLYKPIMNSINHLFDEGILTLDHFFEVRKLIECFSISSAIKNVTMEDIKRLRITNQKMFDDATDNVKFYNTAFHVAIADISGNPLVKVMVQSLLEIKATLIPKSSQPVKLIKDMYRSHDAIIRAMEMKDVKLCEKLMAIHVDLLKNLI